MGIQTLNKLVRTRSAVENVSSYPIEHIFNWLSVPGTLEVTGSIIHIVDRARERKVALEPLLRAFVHIVKKDLCMNLFETALNGGSKNFKTTIKGLKIYYSVYIDKASYRVVFRTLVNKDNDNVQAKIL